MFLKTRTARLLSLALIAGSFGGAYQSTSHADAINLGQAANFAVFGYNNVLDPTPVDVNGNIGVGTGGKMEFHGTGLTIAGQAIYADSITSSNFATSALNGASINGQSFNGSITTGLANGQLLQNSAIAQQAGADIQTLATWAAAQSSNATFPGNMTVNTQNGSGSTYVADLSSLSITSGHTLSITGDSSDYYVFDINGGFTMSGSGSIVLNGVSSDHVLFNIEGTNHTVNISWLRDRIWGHFGLQRPHHR